MHNAHLPLPELGLIAGTRAALGFGLGLLLADRFSPEQRYAVGWTFLMAGLLSTVPLAFDVLHNRRVPALDSVGGPS